jgi:SAM-dependent methyltransferase
MQNSDWHQRYREQASWTRSTRQYLISKIQLEPGTPVLEVGCGTGAILSDFADQPDLHGLDINFDFLVMAQSSSPSATLTCANALNLPYSEATFSMVYCHFFLMWVDTAAALAEMRRVTHPGGWIIAMAEPDYGGRIDYPNELSEIGRLQADSLWKQGAQPEMGRRLPEFFVHAGLQDIVTGVIGAEWIISQDRADKQAEWQVIRNDLRGMLSEDELSDLEQVDILAQNDGSRVLFVPVFFALGRKVEN